MKRLFLLLAVVIIAVAVASAWVLYTFAHRPLVPPSTPFEFTVKPGSSLKGLAKQLQDANLIPDAQWFWWVGRLTEQSKGIRAGTYRLDAPLSPLALLKKLNDGDVVLLSITFVEGITFAEMRAQIEASPLVKSTLKNISDREILQRIGAVETYPEGLFFPDTYRFSAGFTDLDLFKLSYTTMQRKREEAWKQRQADVPYKNAYQALIMASIIEKETGKAEERPLIGSVFTNRLRIPMRLQTDPTVIYGMGQQFDGNIRKRDLTADTPYNTYTRDGLPPTPIAMPGWGSLLAAVQPAQSDRLYFVAKGDGSHYFSATLEEHNRAVAKYQLKR